MRPAQCQCVEVDVSGSTDGTEGKEELLGRGRAADGGYQAAVAVGGPPEAAGFVLEVGAESAVNTVDAGIAREYLFVAGEAAGEVIVVGIEEGDEGVLGGADADIA